MKISSIILLVTFVLSITAMFASNVLLKQEFDKLDKNDTYWTYGKVFEKPFKHLKIEGGNISRISFEPANEPSVRVFKNWMGFENKAVKTSVKNDTLYLNFPNEVTHPNEKKYLQWNTMVRIFSPQLLSVTGHDTNIEMIKMKQKNLQVKLSGKSKLVVQSYVHALDSLQISQQDSTEVVFAISEDLKGKPIEQPNTKLENRQKVRAEPTAIQMRQPLPEQEARSPGWESMSVRAVNASVQGASILDLGHAQIHSLHLEISDTSGIVLSGGTLRAFKKLASIGKAKNTIGH